MTKSKSFDWISPEWPVPGWIKSVVTTRSGGVSLSPYDSFNLAQHVGDDADRVKQNRQLLKERLYLPSEPAWLEQVHGVEVKDLSEQENDVADASYSNQAGKVCVVMTADCLPVLFCNKDGSEVAAAHAGWRGLVNGVLEKTIQQFASPASDITAWLGPAISVDAFEVGEEVKEAFVLALPQSEQAFHAGKPGKWFADLYLLASLRLQQCGVSAIYGGDFCTFHEKERFYSFRRDGQTGRMANLIWIEPHT